MDSRATTSVLPAAARSLLSRPALTSDTAFLVYLALVNFAVHLVGANNYGYFRDELYYLADGRHLAFGYVDQPPLIGWLAALMDLLTHDNLVALHVVSALAAACLTVVVGLIARELGGGRFAQLLAALASVVAIVFMATGSLFSMDVLDELWWALGAYVLVRLIRRQEPRLWLVFGLIAGVGLLTKLTMLFFGFGVVAGFLLTPLRAQFRTRWPWLGGAIAFVFLLPYILWNATNGWPTPEFWRHYGGLSGGGPLGFFGNQVLIIKSIHSICRSSSPDCSFTSAVPRASRFARWAGRTSSSTCSSRSSTPRRTSWRRRIRSSLPAAPSSSSAHWRAPATSSQRQRGQADSAGWCRRMSPRWP